MIAAIGSDGSRAVVWGVGPDASRAIRDAHDWLGDDDDTVLITVPITDDQHAQVRAGAVDVGQLGIKLSAQEIREISEVQS